MFFDPKDAQRFEPFTAGLTGNRIGGYDPAAIASTAVALAPASDLDGDGRPDLLYGARDGSGQDGVAVVFVSATHQLEDLGFALGGGNGDPALLGESTLAAETVLRARLSNSRGSTQAFLVLGMTASHLPLAGGTLVPTPDLILAGLHTGPTGQLDLSGTLPPGIPSGTECYLQYWISDFTGPRGWTASNAVRAVFP